MTHNDPGFSVFWASNGVKRKKPPSEKSCYVGKHIAEDTDKTRESETLGVIVIESGSGVLDGVSYTAGLGSNSVTAVGNVPAYSQPVSGVSNPGTAILSAAAMKGKNGAWPILYGDNPLTSNAFNMAVDEDTIKDKERNHGAEKFAYLVFGQD